MTETMPLNPGRMTKGERAELGQLIRKREKVMKTGAEARSAAMLAAFDTDIAKIYKFDDDEVWKAATEAAQMAVVKAQEMIAERCKELGIPPEFQPSISMAWYGRGENAVENRRAELRRAAKSRIEAMEREAKSRIEKLSLVAQTEVIANGLESATARDFLEKMPAIEDMMPQIDATEIKALIDQRHAPRATEDFLT